MLRLTAVADGSDNDFVRTQYNVDNRVTKVCEGTTLDSCKTTNYEAETGWLTYMALVTCTASSAFSGPRLTRPHGLFRLARALQWSMLFEYGPDSIL
jgi:hypothetical protein